MLGVCMFRYQLPCNALRTVRYPNDVVCSSVEGSAGCRVLVDVVMFDTAQGNQASLLRREFVAVFYGSSKVLGCGWPPPQIIVYANYAFNLVGCVTHATKDVADSDFCILPSSSLHCINSILSLFFKVCIHRVSCLFEMKREIC